MTCKEFLSLLPRYPDDIDQAEKQALLDHAADCPGCAAALAEQEAMLASLATLDDDLDVPDAFADGWRSAIHMEEKTIQKPWYGHWQGWTAAAAALVIMVGGTALMRAGYLFPQSVKMTDAPMAPTPLMAQGTQPAAVEAQSYGLDSANEPLPAAVPDATEEDATVLMADVEETLHDQEERVAKEIIGYRAEDMADEAEEALFAPMEAPSYAADELAALQPNEDGALGAGGTMASDTAPIGDAYQNSAPQAASTGSDSGSATRSTDAFTGPFITKNAQVTLQSAQYEEDLALILQIIENHGGWITSEFQASGEHESSGQTQRSANLEARIMPETLEDLVGALRAVGLHLHSQIDTADVTDGYQQNQAMLMTQSAQDKRLEVLAKGITDTRQLLDIESQRTALQSSMQAIQAQQSAWESDAANATLTLLLEENAGPEDPAAPDSFARRLSRTLAQSLQAAKAFFQDMLLFLILAAPYLLGALVLVIIVMLVYHGIQKRKKKEK